MPTLKRKLTSIKLKSKGRSKGRSKSTSKMGSKGRSKYTRSKRRFVRFKKLTPFDFLRDAIRRASAQKLKA